MTKATFHNFTDRDFIGYWNGKPKTIKAGEQFYTEAWLAEHFAKHLANRELIKGGKEAYVSPKFPAQVPPFMEMFKKAYIPDTSKGSEEDAFDAEISKTATPSMDVVMKKPTAIDQGPAAALADQMAAEETGPGKDPQIITPPADDDDESNFDHGANK